MMHFASFRKEVAGAELATPNPVLPSHERPCHFGPLFDGGVVGGSPVAESDQQSDHQPTQCAPAHPTHFEQRVPEPSPMPPGTLGPLEPSVHCTRDSTGLAPRNSALRLRLPLPVSGGDPGTAFGQSPDSIRRKRSFLSGRSEACENATRAGSEKVHQYS